MDEVLFIEAAKLAADRQIIGRERRAAGWQASLGEDDSGERRNGSTIGLKGAGTAMRTLFGLVLSLTINGAVLGVLDWTVQRAQEPPVGEVSVVQLFDSPGSLTYAQL